MIIEKIFNNNAVLATDDNHDEFVVMGRGIAFKKRTGEAVDRERIEKVFILKRTDASEKFKLMLEDIPTEYISLCYDIIEYAKSMLQTELSDYIYITLTDHINNVFRLLDQGLTNTNPLIWEIRRYYPKEYKVGQKALDFIEDVTERRLPEDEAGNIALHLINAQIKGGGSQFNDIVQHTRKIHDILNIIQYSYNITLNEHSISYERFITHLRYFFQRLNQRRENGEEGMPDNFLFKQVKSKYKQAYECVLKIEKYLGVPLSDEEKLYLTIHTYRVTQREAE